MTSTTTTTSEISVRTPRVSREEAPELCNKLTIVYELPVVKSNRAKKASTTGATATEIDDAADDLDDVIRTVELDRAFMKPDWDYRKLVAHHKIVCDETDDLVKKSSTHQSLHPLLRSFFLVANVPSAGVSIEKRLSSEVQLVFTGEDEHLVSRPVDPEKICIMTEMDLEWFFVVKKGKRSPFSTASTTLAYALTFLKMIESWEANLDVNLKTLVKEREMATSEREARISLERQKAEERRQSEEALNAQADQSKSMGEARATDESSEFPKSCIEMPHDPSSAACETTRMTTPDLSSDASSILPTTTSESECESTPTPEEPDKFFDCEEEKRTSKSLMRSIRAWIIRTSAW